MKTIWVIILFVNTFFSLKGQYFEGEIVYCNKFTSKLANVTSDQMGKLLGTTQRYFIKAGNYKSITDGTRITMQLYDYKTNQIYNKTAQSDTLYWFDASKNTDEVADFQIVKNKGVVLGVKCDALIIKTKSGTTIFFYSSNYKVHISFYLNHNYGNWQYFLNKSGSLPLKTIIETSQFKMESIAIEIKPMKLGDDFFKIDSKTATKKSG